MLKTKHLAIAFVPAIVLVIGGLTWRIIQYEPLYPEIPPQAEAIDTRAELVPIHHSDPVIGDANAPITIIAFEDFGCPACRQQMAILDQLIAKYPSKIRVIWKGISVVRFPYSTRTTHEYAYCAAQQGHFGTFKALAFANSDNLSKSTVDDIVNSIDGLKQKKFTECLSSGDALVYMVDVERLGRALNIQEVPTVFLDNRQIEAPQILEGWETLLELNTNPIQ